jgi:acetyl/propionyl-CoA carboxylase alpha subunit
MEHRAFASGDFDTHFVGKHFEPSLLNTASEEEKMIGAWFASKLFSAKQQNNTSHDRFEKSKWKQNRG